MAEYNLEIGRRGSIPLPNYSAPLQPKLNTWYYPTGASTLGVSGSSLANAAQVQQILNTIGGGDSK